MKVVIEWKTEILQDASGFVTGSFISATIRIFWIISWLEMKPVSLWTVNLIPTMFNVIVRNENQLKFATNVRILETNSRVEMVLSLVCFSSAEM